jgi:hypothetical protein
VIEQAIARIKSKSDRKFADYFPPLPEAEVAAIESAHGVRLPEGYRDFLLQIGNGGNGPPEYGLAQLQSVASEMTDEELEAFGQLKYVMLPFPFTKPWDWESEPENEEGMQAQAYHGCIYLGDDGCGQYWLLIVTGSERGNIWMISGEGVWSTLPKRTFLQWMEEWLDGTKQWW